MNGKQRVIIVALVLAVLLGQGIRWTTQRKGAELVLGQAQMIASAQERPVSAEKTGHCPLVHINTAGITELQTLPGIGPIYAERIITERREQPFQEAEDLLRVSGIGEKRFQQIKDLICLHIPDDE